MCEVLVDAQVEAPQVLSIAPTSDGPQDQIQEEVVEEHLQEHELHQEEAVHEEVLEVLEEQTKCLEEVLELPEALDLLALLLKESSRSQRGYNLVRALIAQTATRSLM